MDNSGTVKFRGKAKVRPPDTFFLPYQKKWIEDDSRLKLMEKGRQIGLSLSTAFRCVDKCAAADNRNDIWVSSRDDLQAKLFIEDCKKFADALNAAYKLVGAEIRDDKPGDASYVLTFANGREIHSLSSNADAQAGKRGTRVLDEFALHPDPRRLYGIAYPGITWGGNLEIISTHRGTDNFFNKLVSEVKFGKNPKKISLHTVTLQNALEQGFLYKLQYKLSEAGAEGGALDMDESDYFNFVKKGCADEETFRQEYMCNPADDNAAFLSYELISKCQYLHGEDWEKFLSPKSERYLGIDVGRVNDLTVFWLLEKLGGVMYTRSVKVFQDTPFSEQEAVLDEYLRDPYLRRVAIDQTGLGRQFAERAVERYGESRVEGVTFIATAKEQLAFPLRSAFEDFSIRIPADREIESDLRAVKKTSGISGAIRFVGERNENGHADRFWALALSVYAGKNTKPAYAPVVLSNDDNNSNFLW